MGIKTCVWLHLNEILCSFKLIHVMKNIRLVALKQLLAVSAMMLTTLVMAVQRMINTWMHTNLSSDITNPLSGGSTIISRHCWLWAPKLWRYTQKEPDWVQKSQVLNEHEYNKLISLITKLLMGLRESGCIVSPMFAPFYFSHFCHVAYFA